MLRRMIWPLCARARRRYPFLRHVSVFTCFFMCLWIYLLHWGERAVYADHVAACNWDSWEKWPQQAHPHHVILIADPQLVDPHTYPGRPWPLSILTERFTDQYMARNFRLINGQMEPDTIIFLGDLFDGGREWATAKSRALKSSQRKELQRLGVLPEDPSRTSGERLASTKADTDAKDKTQEQEVYEEHHSNGKDRRSGFIHGENGRWSKWGTKQWEADFRRFASIFYDPRQLYPNGNREFFEAFDVDADPIAVHNGRLAAGRQEYATLGNSRRLITGLPGNHDIGLGSGVQLAVRDRFQSHFGETSQINVVGNHTFIGIDAPSLSAMSQFDLSSGRETTAKQAMAAAHIWEPAMSWLDAINSTTNVAVAQALQGLYPTEQPPPWRHQVVPPLTSKGENLALVHGRASPETNVRLPVVLLSHVPLYRDPSAHCGTLRERGESLSITAGYQYQNVLTHTLSQKVIQKASVAGEIVQIFSGDDHDYCDVIHQYNVDNAKEQTKTTIVKSIHEITVKSFSWAMGVRRPGFLLASLWNPIDARGETIGAPLPTIQTHLCLLPDQLSIFIAYASAAGATFAAMAIRAIILTVRGSDGQPGTDISSSMVSALPLWRSRMSDPGNNSLPADKTSAKGRPRASSSSTSHHFQQSNGHLAVHTQRSYNARVRSVSPAGYGSALSSHIPAPHYNGALIEKAGYFPEMRWANPSDSDEEDNMGQPEDSQAKWKRRKRTGKVRQGLHLLLASLGVVAAPSLTYYCWVMRT